MTTWTDEQVETLKMLHAKGYSASMAALELGNGFTRNAVIGKLHRLGLRDSCPKEKPSKPLVSMQERERPQYKKPKALRFCPTSFKISEVLPPQPPVNEKAEPGSIALIDLEWHHCRWPIGDVQETGFGFCGAPRELGSSFWYCAKHRRIASRGRARAG